MRFYKDTNGVWLCNNRVAISGTLDATFHGTDIVIKKLGQDSVDAEYYRGPITNIEKETAPGAGTFISVTDKADFLSTYKDFFVNPLNPLKEDVEGLQQDVLAIQGGYLGTLLHTDAAPEPGVSGIYKFISAGVVSWLSGTPTVAVGDEVSVVFTDPTYTYTYIQNPYELLANKQNSLAADGTGVKYPTVDAVNAVTISSERVLAEVINQLNSRISSLELFLQNPIFNNIQAETVSAVSSLQFKGAELIRFGAGAPSFAPDFIGQIYIKTDATVAVYIATGVATSGDWKSV